MDDAKPCKMLEEQIRVYLRAGRHLAACREYGETQFDEVQDILRDAPLGGSMTPEQRAEVKARVRGILPDRGVAPWDKVRVMDHASLAEAVSEFMGLLLAMRPGEETRAFIQWATKQMDEIMQTIRSTQRRT